MTACTNLSVSQLTHVLEEIGQGQILSIERADMVALTQKIRSKDAYILNLFVDKVGQWIPLMPTCDPPEPSNLMDKFSTFLGTKSPQPSWRLTLGTLQLLNLCMTPDVFNRLHAGLTSDLYQRVSLCTGAKFTDQRINRLVLEEAQKLKETLSRLGWGNPQVCEGLDGGVAATPSPVAPVASPSPVSPGFSLPKPPVHSDNRFRKMDFGADTESEAEELSKPPRARDTERSTVETDLLDF